MLDVYWRWLRFGATAKELSTLLLVGFVGSELCSIGAQVWVGHWADATAATAAVTTAVSAWRCIPLDVEPLPDDTGSGSAAEKNGLSSVQRMPVSADTSPSQLLPPCGPHEQAAHLVPLDPQEGIVWYIGIYAAFSLSAVAVYFWRNWRWATNVVRAAAQLHERLLLNVLRYIACSLLCTIRLCCSNGHCGWRDDSLLAHKTGTVCCCCS